MWPFAFIAMAIVSPKSDQNDGQGGTKKAPREVQKEEWEPSREGEKAGKGYGCLRRYRCSRQNWQNPVLQVIR
jgi:hypothetical protein